MLNGRDAMEGRKGMEWNGMEWNRMEGRKGRKEGRKEWNGMVWNGKEWKERSRRDV